jgi:hypothetical protein
MAARDRRAVAAADQYGRGADGGSGAADARTFPQARLFAMYGLTEAFRSTFLDPALIDTHPTSMGRRSPMPKSWW